MQPSHPARLRKFPMFLLAGCGFLLIFFLCACSLFLFFDPDKGKRFGENQAAPDFTLLTTGGEEVSLRDFLGKPVIVNFWATWCGPCRAEMPGMEAIHRRYKDSGLTILALNTGEGKNEVIGFAQDLGLSFLILLDEDQHISDNYMVNSIPQSFFIDRQGVIRRVVVGSIQEEELEAYVQEILQVETSETATSQPQAKLLKGCVNTAVLNVRNGPGSDHTVIRGLSSGECKFFDAASADQKWLRLADLKSSSGERLWVATQYIDLQGEIESLPTIE